MYPIVQFKMRMSQNPGEVPGLSALHWDELAYNIPDGILYAKRMINSVERIVILNSGGMGLIHDEDGDTVEIIDGQLQVGGDIIITDNLGNPINPATEETLSLSASLIETLQELTSRLSLLAGMANSGAPALRVAPISSVSTAVTGPITQVQDLANNLTMRIATENNASIQSNAVVDELIAAVPES